MSKIFIQEGEKMFPKLKIDDLEVELAIVQGGMGVGISLSGLASAVANEGGIGVISAAGIGMLEPDYQKNLKAANQRALIKEIRRAREKTDGVIGVNVLMALSDADELIETSINEGVDVLFLGAGLPLKNYKKKKSKTKIIPIVSSAKGAKTLFNYWAKNYNDVPDGIVVEGPLAGGHLGYRKNQLDDQKFSLERILPEISMVIEQFREKFRKDIPIIAAGGIYTGEDIRKYIEIGAQGVQMATRFVATYECDASQEFKNAYLKCKKDDIVIIDSPVGLPGRAIKNEFLDEVSLGNKKPFKCLWKCLRTCDFKSAPYCIALALTNAKKGFLNDGFAFAGANAYKVDRIISVKELINTLKKEYQLSIELTS
ncbi:MAG: nitronate monooxygenase [Thermotogaceae bacterium]|jgi:NAD(P)H-dependent flavin oxidoreductase YrpB (nitropropane dioxygenase family)|nr:nitronate monooxygenase [Thermotogaceae bacterium]